MALSASLGKRVAAAAACGGREAASGKESAGRRREHRGRETSERREEERKTRTRNLVENCPRGFLQNDPCVIYYVPEGVHPFGVSEVKLYIFPEKGSYFYLLKIKNQFSWFGL
jgi:hypothetical protein